MGYFCNRAPNTTYFTRFCATSTSTPRKHRFLRGFMNHSVQKIMERQKTHILQRFLPHQLALYNAFGILLRRDIQTMGLFKVFCHGFWHDITKTRVYCVLGHEVNRLFLHQGTENFVFYKVLCNTVQKTSYFYAVSAWAVFSATKSRKHSFSQGFTPHGSENLVFYVGLVHPRYFHGRTSKTSIFAVIFATPHKKHCILRGFGADPIFL